MKSLTPAQVSARLLALSRSLERDFHGLSLEFAIERLIARLIQDAKLSKHLVFKGGYVMLKAHESERATIDLDTSIHGISITEAEARAIAVVEGENGDGLWMGAIESRDLEHQTKYNGRRLTIRFAFGAPKIEAKRLGKVILDIGAADVITPKPIMSELVPLLGGDPISWSVYPIETIIAEKLHALVSHGAANSRSKDVYDLTVLLKRININRPTVQQAIKATFAHRSTLVPESFAEFWRELDKTMLGRAAGAIVLASGEQVKFDELVLELGRLLS